jgi:hypothetical protein
MEAAESDCGSAVTGLWAGRADNRDSILFGVRAFSLHQRAQTGPGVHLASCPFGDAGSFSPVKRPGSQPDHSGPSSSGVKNALSYTSTSYTSSWRGAKLPTKTASWKLKSNCCHKNILSLTLILTNFRPVKSQFSIVFPSSQFLYFIALLCWMSNTNWVKQIMSYVHFTVISLIHNKHGTMFVELSTRKWHSGLLSLLNRRTSLDIEFCGLLREVLLRVCNVRTT